MKFRVEKKKEIFAGKVITLRQDRIRLPGGKRLVRDLVVHRGAVAIVPFLSRDEVVLVRQFRYAAGGFIWEIPAGTLEDRESPVRCARRELEEETGYRAGYFRKLHEFYTAPGFCNEVMHLYVAWDLVPAVRNLDEDEYMETRIFRWSRVQSALRTGSIRDAKTMVGLLWCEKVRKEIFQNRRQIK